MKESQMSRSTEPFIHSTVTQKEARDGSSEERYPTNKPLGFYLIVCLCSSLVPPPQFSFPAPSLCPSTLLSSPLSFVIQKVSNS